MKNAFMFFLAALCLYHSANGQAIENVQLPVKMLTVTGSTSDDPAAYEFEEIENTLQGVNIHLPPTEIAVIFLRSGNSRLAFNTINSTIYFNKLEVNYDNSGWINLHDGANIESIGWIEPPESFQTIGVHNLKVKYFNPIAGAWRYREYNVILTPPADEFHRDGFRTYTHGGNLITTGNQLYLYDHPSCPYADPVLVVEGFDPANTTYPEFYRFRGAFLCSKLYELGYKVYVLNFNMNSQSMFNNAAVVSSAINYISTLNDNTNVLLIGASMGGVISRFVAARAENDSIPLPLSGLITLDAPHQGAILDAELQFYLQDCDSDLSSAIIGSQAAKELLTFNAFDLSGTSRSVFMDSLSGLTGGGYPLGIPVMGVAHSSQQPNPNPVGSTWLDVQNIVCQGRTFPHTSITTLPGSLLSQGFTQIDPVKFFYWQIDVNRISDPTFVAHSSALDLDSLGVSAMLYPISTTDTTVYFHDVIPEDVVFAIEETFR
jgi:pimeloyl-ACP methyl ester carboxylesterase